MKNKQLSNDLVWVQVGTKWKLVPTAIALERRSQQRVLDDMRECYLRTLNRQISAGLVPEVKPGVDGSYPYIRFSAQKLPL